MTVQHTIEHVDTKPAITPLHLWPGASPFYVPKECEADVVALLKEERALMFEPGEPLVRRALDLGANVGEFALYCRMRWPYAWVDCLPSANSDEHDTLCLLNAPTGTRMLDDLPNEDYDLLRIDRAYKTVDPTQWSPKIIFFDGCAPAFNNTAYDLKACGMRRKNEPFQWWVRKPVSA